VATAVFDIDGVVADVRHRLHFLATRPARWGDFFAAAGEDGPLEPGIARVRQASSAGHDIVWLTGRPEWLREVTRSWLAVHRLPNQHLIMRPNGDFRPARILKVEVLRRLDAGAGHIAEFVDDDPDVVASARAAGFPVTQADWVPHTRTLRNAQERDGRT
jgi:hypothetical protein